MGLSSEDELHWIQHMFTIDLKAARIKIYNDKGSISSYPPVFSANLEEMSLVFSLVSAVLSFMLGSLP
jgi:hypothetical protein